MKKLLSLSCVGLLLLMVAVAACATPTATPVPPTPTAVVVVATPTAGPTPTPIMVVATPTAGPTPTAAPPKTLKIGVLQALTGPGAGWGLSFYRGCMLVQQDINAAGGLKVGADRYMIELAVWDSKYVADQAVAGVNKLLYEDRVKFIFGGTGTPDTMAVREICEREKVLQFFGSWSVQAPGPMGFRFSPSATREMPTIVPWYLKQHPEIKRVATTDPNDAVGTAMMPRHVAAWQAAGVEVVFNQYYDTTTKDFGPFLTSVLRTNPDFVDLCNTYPTYAALQIKQLRELGYTGLIGAEGNQVPEDLLGTVPAQSLENVYFVYVHLTRPDATEDQKAFHSRYLQAFGSPFRPDAVQTFTCMQALCQAIEKAGSVDPIQVLPVIETGKFNTVMGQYYMATEKAGDLPRVAVYPFQLCRMDKGETKAYLTVQPQ